MTTKLIFIFLTSIVALLVAWLGYKHWLFPVSDHQESILRISIEEDPQTLDPRQVRDLPTATIIHMLYEGLTRLDANGQPQPALAEEIILSPDQKTYTFKMRKSGWSNGKLITAYDFEQSLKSLLNPHFPAPNAYQFYVIKGAQAAKEGRVPLDQVGIRALDDFTLVIELENSIPYFLNLTSTYFYYPANIDLHQKALLDEQLTIDSFVSNGPFKLEKWSHNNELIVIKNPYYWDADHVHLNKIIVMVLDNTTALQMFGRNELDWMGSPLSTIPTDAVITLKKKGDLQIKPGAGTYWFRFNIERFPFNHPKIRRAFSLALNRQELIEHVLQGNQAPALGVIPLSLVQKNAPLYKDHDVIEAQQLLEEALMEMNIARHDIAPVILCYAAGERSHKIAQVAQQQWKHILGTEVHLQSCEKAMYFDRLKRHDYQISLGSWFADIADPISFLDIFKFKNNGTNNTQWENSDYIQLLNLSSKTTNKQQRENYLKQAEHILIEYMPIAPLFYSAFNYLKQSYIKGVYFSELGYLDFKQAYIEKNEGD